MIEIITWHIFKAREAAQSDPLRAEYHAGEIAAYERLLSLYETFLNEGYIEEN